MDWRGVKSLLIVAFLLLNILLAYQLWMDELNLNKFQENAEKREEIRRLAAIKEIELEMTIPEQTPQISEVTVKFTEEQEQTQGNPVTLDNPIESNLIDDIRQLKTQLKKQIPQIEEYEIDPYALPAEQSKLILNQLSQISMIYFKTLLI